MVRSTYYRWKHRRTTGELEDKKPVAKNCWWRLSEDSIEKVKHLTGMYPEIASQWVIGKLAKISGSSVGKIWKSISYHGIGVKTGSEGKAPGMVEWLKIHACWALDMMWIRYKGVWLYLMVLVEEYSRLLLGWRLSAWRSGNEAWKLVEDTIRNIGKTPLVLKHDRAGELLDEELQLPLREYGIVSLPSPAYYAPFNGKVERAIKEVRKFTRDVDNRYDISMEDLTCQIRRAFNIINEVLPRRIFNGKTSRKVYELGEEYQSDERNELISRMKQEIIPLEMRHGSRTEYLDDRRRIIVHSVQLSNLCEVKYGCKSQAVFTPICRIR